MEELVHYPIRVSSELTLDTCRHSSACSNQPPPKSQYDGDVMPLQHFYEPKPAQYQIVLKESDNYFAPNDTDSISISFGEEYEEEMRINGNLACSQDSDSDDTDALLTPLNLSLNHLILDSQLSKANQDASYICIKEADSEAKIEEGLTKAAEHIDKIIATCDKAKNLRINPKITQETVKPTPKLEKQPQCNRAKVLFVSDVWQAQFHLHEMVAVRHDREEYQHTVRHSNGGDVTFTYKKVKPVSHKLFTKWKQINDNMHCDTTVAYLEDEKFGYIVREYFDNGLDTVIDKIMSHQEKIAKEQAKFYDHLYITYFMSWRRRGELQKEFRRLNQLLKYIFTGLIDAVECLHQLDHVSLNLHANNLFLRFSCGCWGDPACVHGSTGVTVVIGNYESAYAVGSLINGPTHSKALKLLDPMHKYKRAEIAYDLLDLVIFITEQLSKISGNTDCEIKMNTWISNIANAVITDPPVKEVLELCMECGIAQNDTIKIIDYLKVSADHYARLNGEHEV